MLIYFLTIFFSHMYYLMQSNIEFSRHYILHNVLLRYA